MSGILANGIQGLLDLFPALAGVFAGSILFFWLLALLGCLALCRRNKE